PGGDGAGPVDSGGPAGDGGRAKAPPPRGEQSEFTRHVILFNTLALHARSVLESVQNGTYSIEEQAAAIELVRSSLEAAWDELERSDVPRQYVHDVAKLGLHWGALQANEVFVSPTEERDANAERIGLNQAIESCASITREAMYAIALDRLYAWVRVQEPEYAVDLHAVLRDEIPDRADREDVIAWLSSAPRVLSSVGGIIEPETGLIYRTYDRWLARAARVVLVAVVLAGTLVATRSLAPFVLGEAPGAAGEAAGGVVAIDAGDSPQPITSETQLLISWVACVLGLLAHSVLTTYRSIR